LRTADGSYTLCSHFGSRPLVGKAYTAFDIGQSCSMSTAPPEPRPRNESSRSAAAPSTSSWRKASAS
jgi:hypothetical protein